MDNRSEIHRVLAALAKEEGETSSETGVGLRAKGDAPVASELGEAGTERRRCPRYKCEGSAEFRVEGHSVRTWATVTDLSRTGCYVEMHSTFPQHTNVDLTIDVAGIRFRTKGNVRIAYPFLGMGIAFTEMSDQDRTELDTILFRLAAGPREPEAESATKPLDLSRILDQSVVLGEVAKFFQDHKALSREQFAELLSHHTNLLR